MDESKKEIAEPTEKEDNRELIKLIACLLVVSLCAFVGIDLIFGV